jgi:putative spermidine/putrescine transport system permease protein
MSTPGAPLGRRLAPPSRSPNVPWILLAAPLLAFYLLLFLLPQAVFISNSFFRAAGPAQVSAPLTLENYAAILSDSYYYHAFAESVQLGLLVVVFTLLLGYPLAYKIARTDSRWASLLLLVVVISAFSDVVARTLGWKVILGRAGPLAVLLEQLGLAPPSLVNNLTGATIGLIHAELPIMTLLLVPVIRSIDPALEQAAEGLGASKLRSILYVTLPMSLPGVIAGTLVVFAVAMSSYTTPQILGGGRVPALPILIQQQIQVQLNYARGSALALLLLLVVSSIVVLAILLTRRAGASDVAGRAT